MNRKSRPGEIRSGTARSSSSSDAGSGARDNAEITEFDPASGALEDEEVASSIRDQFREEVGTGLGGVHVACRRGRVILSGEIASEELREVARLIVQDENGLEVDDRLIVTSIAGEYPGENEQVDRGLPGDAGMTGEDLAESDVSDDILEVEEEGIGFDAPSRPVPER